MGVPTRELSGFEPLGLKVKSDVTEENMDKRFISSLLVFCLIALCGPGTNATVVSFPVSGTLPASIPDNAAGISRTFTVTGVPANAQLVRVTLTMNMTHTWVGDLRATLTSPDNETHTLFYDIGDTGSPAGNGDSSNLSGAYTFTDTAATTLWTASLAGNTTYNIPAANYRTTNINANTATSMDTTFGYPGLPLSELLFRKIPEKSVADESAELTNGTWTLQISDNAGGDTGAINTGTQLNVEFNVVTAAGASVQGRLLTADGRGVTNATVVITNPANGAAVSTRSTSFGYFNFEDLPVGQSYVIQVVSKRFQFPTQVLQLDDNVTDLVIEASPE